MTHKNPQKEHMPIREGANDVPFRGMVLVLAKLNINRQLK
jgi:hypothetical protein